MKILLTASLIFSFWTAAAQNNFESDWLNVVTGYGSIVTKVEIDQGDNIYNAGIIRSSDPNFDGTNNVDDPYYGYISKVSPKGEFIWGFTLINASQNLSVHIADMKLSSDNNLIVVGNFTGAVDFDPSPNENILIAPFREVFIASYSEEGNLNWVKQLKKNVQSTYDYSHSVHNVDLDRENNIILSGRFGGQVDFDPSENSSIQGTPGLNSNYLGYLLKMNSQGEFIWVKILEAGNDSGLYANKSDGENNIITTGYFKDSIHLQSDFVDTIFQVNTPFASYIKLLLKYNSQGKLLWVERVFTGAWNHLKIEMTSNNDFYVMGRFYGAIRFYPYNFDDIIIEHNNQSVYDYDSFIAKLDSNGKLIWCKPIATPIATHIIDAKIYKNNVHISVGGADTLFYGGKLLNNYTGNFCTILKIDSNGEPQQELNLSNDLFRNIESFDFDSNYGLIIGGSAINNSDFPIDFEPSQKELFISDLGRIAFLQRLQERPITNTEDLFLYPNPAQHEIKVFTGQLDLPAEMKIYDQSGRLVFQSHLLNNLTSISLEKFANGVHTISIEQPYEGQVKKKFVKM